MPEHIHTVKTLETVVFLAKEFAFFVEDDCLQNVALCSLVEMYVSEVLTTSHSLP
jgi:hypothetical protein